MPSVRPPNANLINGIAHARMPSTIYRFIMSSLVKNGMKRTQSSLMTAKTKQKRTSHGIFPYLLNSRPWFSSQFPHHKHCTSGARCLPSARGERSKTRCDKSLLNGGHRGEACHLSRWGGLTFVSVGGANVSRW